MSPLDNLTVVWIVITVAACVITGALGYLLGEADGLREVIRRDREP